MDQDIALEWRSRLRAWHRLRICWADLQPDPDWTVVIRVTVIVIYGTAFRRLLLADFTHSFA